MKKRNVIIASLLAVAMLGGTAIGTASAFPGHHCDHGAFRHNAMGMHAGAMGESGYHMMRLMEKLNLTKSQRDRIWKIVDTRRDQAREKMFALMSNRKALRTATTSNHYDAQKIRQLADAQGRLMADLMVIRAEAKHSIRSVLTPEQRSQFDHLGHHRGNGSGRR